MKQQTLGTTFALLACMVIFATACDAQDTAPQVTREDADDPYFATQLFKANGIDIDPGTVRRVLRDQIETVVWINSRYKDLPVFYHDSGYSFDRNRKLAMMPGTDQPMVLGAPLPPASAFPDDIEPDVDPATAVDAWLDATRSDSWFGADFEPQGEPQVTLGFLDANLGTGRAPRMLLVWRVRPAAGEYPEAMIDAKSGSLAHFDSGVRSALPIQPDAEPAQEEETESQAFDPVGTWESGRCTGRDYRRVITFAADKQFSATDYVAPCPAGATCVWSGIVNRSGTWSMRNGSNISLSGDWSAQRQGAPLATNLHYDALSARILEATPGSPLDCQYARSRN